MKKALLNTTVALVATGIANGALFVDFNSTNQDGGPHNQTGYQAFDAGHEVAADVGQNNNGGTTGDGTVVAPKTVTFATTFVLTGAANIDVTPAWPNTNDRRVRQSIDRGAGYDQHWADPLTLDLATDFLGTDTRTGGGGNGNWDGTTGTPTYMTLTLNGLAAGNYDWTSFHADTENVHVNFGVEIDNGSGFTQLADGSMTDATPNSGNPNSQTDGSGLYATEFGPLNTYTTRFAADGTNDVTMRFTPYSGEYGAVHNQIWGINGFQVEQVPEPSSAGVLGLLGATLLIRRRHRRH